MGIKDNFTQAMKELTNPRPSDARKEVRDVASYMNDTADAQPTEPVQPVQSVQNAQHVVFFFRAFRQRIKTFTHDAVAGGAGTGFFTEDSP